jgi:hypothetical protein
MDELLAQEQLIQWLLQDQQRMQILQIAAEFCQKNHLNDWCLGAGFVRNLVWDHLHNYVDGTSFHDIDLIYFNSEYFNCEYSLESIDSAFEQDLKQSLDINWSVKNQARMHCRNHDVPYKNTIDAMSYWPEIETAVGVSLSQNEINIVAPFGLKSLFEGKITLNPKRPKLEIFHQRIQRKRWLEKWPQLQIN